MALKIDCWSGSIPDVDGVADGFVVEMVEVSPVAANDTFDLVFETPHCGQRYKCQVYGLPADLRTDFLLDGTLYMQVCVQLMTNLRATVSALIYDNVAYDVYPYSA